MDSLEIKLKYLTSEEEKGILLLELNHPSAERQ